MYLSSQYSRQSCLLSAVYQTRIILASARSSYSLPYDALIAALLTMSADAALCTLLYIGVQRVQFTSI